MLVAVDHGWTCPALGCDYRQNWAHKFMAEGPWPRPELRSPLVDLRPTDLVDVPDGELTAEWRGWLGRGSEEAAS